MQAQFAKGPEKGFRFLSTFEAGFRSMTTKDPIRVPADAKGKKLRTFPNEMMRWTLEAMGFNIQIMPLPEVYLAIQQGVVSGQENPIDTISANKFYEVAPNVTLTQHVYSPIPLTISEKTWQKLSPADREAITRAAKEAADWSRKEVSGNDDKLLKEMESKGAKIGGPTSRRSATPSRPCTPRPRRSTAPTSTRSSPTPTPCARRCRRVARGGARPAARPARTGRPPRRRRPGPLPPAPADARLAWGEIGRLD